MTIVRYHLISFAAGAAFALTFFGPIVAVALLWEIR